MARRRRWMRQPLSWRRGGAVALLVLLAVAAAALVLDARSGGEFEPVREAIRERSREPAQLLAETGRSARVVLLSDAHDVPAMKRVAVMAIEAMARGPGLDAVAVEIPSPEQPYIDAYLGQQEENAAMLLARPDAVQERYGAPREMLEIYRTVWRLNRELGAARRIRIIAADLPTWPPPRGMAAPGVAQLYARRTEHMLARLDDEILSIKPDARILVFVDGYLALKRTYGEASYAGGDPIRIDWLGERLRQRAPHDTRSVLIDAAGAIAGVRPHPGYHGTRLFRALRREVDGTTAVRIGDAFAAIDDPVLETSMPGLRVDILPRGYSLVDAADGYILLQPGR